jgi:purine nucleoside phosphorylase
MTNPAVGIIGGSGLYQMEQVHDPTEHKIDTPFERLTS